ncbi:MAG TPA: hypothetical protein DEB10_01440 [Ruminococcaceae bacterium]|jgi:hypothetical protein|nr:hypothetical protein [Oscillospiraceae bacterium]
MIVGIEDEERDAIMRRKLYGNNVEATCEYCLYGRRSSDGKAVLCPKKGVMPLYHHCRKFIYDPLKRIPSHQPQLEKFSEDDFKIDV